MLGLTATRTGRKLAAGSTSAQKAIQQLLDKYKNQTAQGVLGQYANRALVSGGLLGN
jgi:hypothetical protein